jgi:hypothetical protein
MSLELPPPRVITQSEYTDGLENRLNVTGVRPGTLLVLSYSVYLVAFTLRIGKAALSEPEGAVFIEASFNAGEGEVQFGGGLGLPFLLSTNMLREQPDGATGYLLNSPEDNFDRSVSAMLGEEAAASRALVSA